MKVGSLEIYIFIISIKILEYHLQKDNQEFYDVINYYLKVKKQTFLFPNKKKINRP